MKGFREFKEFREFRELSPTCDRLAKPDPTLFDPTLLDLIDLKAIEDCVTLPDLT